MVTTIRPTVFNMHCYRCLRFRDFIELKIANGTSRFICSVCDQAEFVKHTGEEELPTIIQPSQL